MAAEVHRLLGICWMLFARSLSQSKSLNPSSRIRPVFGPYQRIVPTGPITYSLHIREMVLTVITHSLHIREMVLTVITHSLHIRETAPGPILYSLHIR